MKKPLLTEYVMKNVYFDTCVYHQPGIDLLLKVIPVENILFGSEMVGAVRGIDPETGQHYDDTKRYIDASSLAGRRQAAHLRRQCDARLSASCGADSAEADMDPDYLPFCATPSKPRFVPPPGAVDAHCHVFGPASKFPYAPERKYTPCDAPEGDAVRTARDFLGFSRNRHRPGDLPRPRQPAPWPTPMRTSGGRARGVASVGPRTSRMRSSRSCMMRACAAVRFNFVKRLVDFTPREALNAIAERIAPARLARRGLFRGGRSRGARAVLHSAADQGHRRPYGPARRRQGHRPSRLPALRRADGRASAHLEQGERGRAAVADRTAPTTISRHSAAPSSSASPTACCGARTGRIPTSRRTCPTTAFWSTWCRSSRRRRRSSRRCWSTTRCGCTGGIENRYVALRGPLRGHLRVTYRMRCKRHRNKRVILRRPPQAGLEG